MFFFLITSQSTKVMDELNAVTSLHRCAKLYREVWDSLDHWIISKEGNSEQKHFWLFPVGQEDGRTPVEVVHQHAGADGRIWIDDRAAATLMPKAFSLGGFLTLVDLTKHFAVRCRPQQIANALWSFAVLMFQPLNCWVAFSDMEICQWMRIWQGACTGADFFGAEIRQTDTSESQLPIKHLGQGQLIFCLCFAGGQSQKKKSVLPRGTRRSRKEFDHHYLTAPWSFFVQVRSGTPWHICRTECVQQPLGIGYIRFHW